MLSRKTPMKRTAIIKGRSVGMSFYLQPAEDRPPAPPPKPLSTPAKYARIDQSTHVAVPKTVARRNAALLDLARGQVCQLMVPGVCNFNTETTVACHSNWSDIGGKSGARKADDCYVAYGCSSCHAWLDQGAAPVEKKRTVFTLAMMRQVRLWLRMQVSKKPRDVNASSWALAHLANDGALTNSLEFQVPVLVRRGD